MKKFEDGLSAAAERSGGIKILPGEESTGGVVITLRYNGVRGHYGELARAWYRFSDIEIFLRDGEFISFLKSEDARIYWHSISDAGDLPRELDLDEIL